MFCSTFCTIGSRRVSQVDNKARLKRACSTTVAALQTTLRILRAVPTADAGGAPSLHAGIASLLFVLDGIKKTSQNADDVEKLSRRIEDLNRLLQIHKNGGTLSSAAIDRIDRLFTALSVVLEELRKMASCHGIKRFLHSDDDSRLISSHLQKITSFIQNFIVETMLSVECALDEKAVKIQEKIDNLHEATTGGFQQLNERLDTKDCRHAIFSSFDCKDRVRCLKGTRTDILAQIFGWIGISDWPRQDATGISIFWISGSAGIGKTTIACTVAEACRAHGVLGASFFCSRDDADGSNPRLIFASIAYQLGNFSQLFRAEVTHILKLNPDIGYASPPYQLEELIIKPLRTLGSSLASCLVVLDALDECNESGATSVILSSLSRHVNELFPLKFLVTSRPESHIMTSSFLNPAIRRFVLHEVESSVVQSDIERYLSSKLARTRELYRLGSEWPSAADVHALTLLSSGLFIFASTSVRFIQDRNYSDPRTQLARLLRNAPTATESSSPQYGLDQLYAQVLIHAFPNISPHLSGRLKIVLGTIVLLREPISSLTLERLLGVESCTIRETLRHLHSIVTVPDDDTQVIRTLHPSLCDFMTSPTRCLNPMFVVDPWTQHTLLAHACLQAMKQLRRDMCGIKNPSMLNSEVDDLPTRVKSCIPLHLHYACRHWAWHLANATFSDVLLDLVKEFCLKRLLYWVEAFSLLGGLRSALLALGVAQQAIAKADKDMTDSILLLHDCERFTSEFFSVISTSSLQIYHSALLFTPRLALIRKIYETELDLPVKVCNASDDLRSSCVRTIEGHSSWVKSVAFSPDGMCIVSGSDDATLRLWDAISGAHLNTLEGHSGSVWSVAFSPDGTRIVSASGDKTLRLWDAASGSHRNTLDGHSSSVRSVAFSPNGARIVSGSYDKTLRLWDAASGAHLDTLMGHSSTVLSVMFSPDGAHIVSGSYDKTIRLWDALSGAHLRTLDGCSSSVRSVGFSPDGMRIVSGSDDCTLRLWDAVSGRHLNTLIGHSFSVLSVAFSRDGTRIVSGSSDCTLRLWDAVNGTHLNTLTGHFHSVLSVAFSPDSTRIVSASSDETLRLWDTGAHPDTLKQCSSSVHSIAFSRDGTRIVSGSGDCTLRLWDAVSGAHLNTLVGHSSPVISATFSPDLSLIVSGSDDNTLRLWDAASGEHLNTLNGHSSSVRSVAFSPDGTRILSGSDDCTLRLWDTASGAHLNTFIGHSGSVPSVAFSPDGTRIVSGSVDYTLRLWDAASGVQQNTLKGHFSRASSVARSCNLSQGLLLANNSTRAIFGYISEDGWVNSISWNRRICWIPVACRPRTLAVYGDRVAFGTRDGRVLILDFTGMETYFRNL